MYPKISDVQLFSPQGPWKTKSNGNLFVPIALPLDAFRKAFLCYNTRELARTTEDLRGFRLYTIHALQNGARGAGEFHRLRTEILLVMHGKTRWTVEDLYGEKKIFALSQNDCVLTPPFIMHDYEILEDDTTLLVICNTLLDPDRPDTKDSYSRDEFSTLKKPR